VTRRLVLRPLAEDDLSAVWTSTAERWSVAQAQGYLEGLNATLVLLAQQPYIARLRPEFDPPLRLYPHRQHLLVFITDDRVIEVIRVLHARSDWQALLGE
jgi:toxin ParE1/3/4